MEDIDTFADEDFLIDDSFIIYDMINLASMLFAVTDLGTSKVD